jgi:hypothetical protein
VLAVAPGETDVATLGTRQGFAVCCDPDRPGEVVTAVRTLAGNPPRLKTMGLAAAAAAPGYDRVQENARFERILCDITRRSTG